MQVWCQNEANVMTKDLNIGPSYGLYYSMIFGASILILLSTKILEDTSHCYFPMHTTPPTT